MQMSRRYSSLRMGFERVLIFEFYSTITICRMIFCQAIDQFLCYRHNSLCLMKRRSAMQICHIRIQEQRPILSSAKTMSRYLNDSTKWTKLLAYWRAFCFIRQRKHLFTRSILCVPQVGVIRTLLAWSAANPLVPCQDPRMEWMAYRQARHNQVFPRPVVCLKLIELFNIAVLQSFNTFRGLDR